MVKDWPSISGREGEWGLREGPEDDDELEEGVRRASGLVGSEEVDGGAAGPELEAGPGPRDRSGERASVVAAAAVCDRCAIVK